MINNLPTLPILFVVLFISFWWAKYPFTAVFKSINHIVRKVGKYF